MNITKSFAVIFFFACFHLNAQDYSLDTQRIDSILSLKKEMMKNHKIKSFYTIQLFSGSKEGAIKTREDYYKKEYSNEITIEYETPNYKVWVGKFRTKLEADKVFNAIKKDYPYALVFMPGR